MPVQFEPQFQFVGYQGLASHGGAVGILVAMILFSRKYKISLSWTLDKLALVVPLAGFLIRLGNLMNSEIIGKPSDAPWSFLFVRVDQVPRHPAQLYEAMLYLTIFFYLNWLYKSSSKQHGYIFGLFLILLFTTRFVVEFAKEPQSDFEQGMIINMGQLLSLPFIVFGFVLVLANNKNRIVYKSS